MAAGDSAGQVYMEVDPRIAPSFLTQADVQSTGMQDAAFAYAYTQLSGKMAVVPDGDRATIDAIYAIAQQYKTPPATPTLSSLNPNTAVHGGAAFTMTLTGTGFTPGSSVVFGTLVESRVTFVSATSLTVVIYPASIANAGTIAVKVRPGGGAADSGSVNFTVT